MRCNQSRRGCAGRLGHGRAVAACELRRGVARDDRSGLAECAQVLAGIEAEATDPTNRPDALLLESRHVPALRLQSDNKPFRSANSVQACEVAGLSVQMDGKMAFVRGVIARSTKAGSRVKVVGSIST